MEFSDDDLNKIVTYDLHPEDILEIPTQSLLFKREDLLCDQENSDRFGPAISRDKLTERLRDRIPKKTRANNKFATNTFSEWAKSRNQKTQTFFEDYYPVPSDLAKTEVKEMSYWLTRFVMEVRRKDGSDYPPQTLYNIVMGIQRYLREECGRVLNFLSKDDHTFQSLRQTLDARMKELSGKGLGVRKRTDPITEEDENRLWDSGVINLKNATGLSYGVFFYCGKVFAFRGYTEHRECTVEQYSFTVDSSGQKALVYQEHVSKTVQGGLNHRKKEPKRVVQYSDASNPRDVVNLFETYFKYIPAVGPLYRRPLSGDNETPKYSQQPLGVNTLARYLPTMVSKAGIDTGERKVTNHSARVYCCSSMYQQGFDEQQVMARSGHGSTAVRDYKRPSERQLQDISNALQPPKCTKSCLSPTMSLADSEKDNKTDALQDRGDNILSIKVPSCVNVVVIEKDGQKIKLSL